MKIIVSVLAMLAFVAAAQADDMKSETAPMNGDAAAMKSDAADMKSESADQPAATAAPAAVQGTVARAAITKGVEDHEPIDNLTDVTTNTGKVYYFTELDGMQGQTVTHRWEHNGEKMAEVSFDVGGPRWRVYSSKNLLPSWTGEWKVSVVDAGGNTLRSDTFMYTEAPKANAMSGDASKDTMTKTAPDAQPQTSTTNQ